MTYRDKLIAELHALAALSSSGAYKSLRRTSITLRIDEILGELYPILPDA